MAYVVSSPGSCGEFIQGYTEGASFMVTCPINRYAMALVDDKADEALPDKAEEAVKKTLAYLGETDRPSVRLISSIPKGKGLASSTADISAVAQAVALSFGRKLSMEEIAHIALSIEPSESVSTSTKIRMDSIPKEPTRLSFMISRQRSFERPENRPSEESISPSASVPPVRKSSPTTRRNPVKSGTPSGFIKK